MLTKPDSAAKIIGVIGASRGDGNTVALARAVFAHLPGAVLFDLTDYPMAAYNYGQAYAPDGFGAIVDAMADADAIVLASPVYWYAMSGQMKIFFDRLTDLTESRKALGKSLAGKAIFVIATGGSPAPPAAFEPPFADTAGYFNMTYGGMLYGHRAAIDETAAQVFAAHIREAARLISSVSYLNNNFAEPR